MKNYCKNLKTDTKKSLKLHKNQTKKQPYIKQPTKYSNFYYKICVFKSILFSLRSNMVFTLKKTHTNITLLLLLLSQ